LCPGNELRPALHPSFPDPFLAFQLWNGSLDEVIAQILTPFESVCRDSPAPVYVWFLRNIRGAKCLEVFVHEDACVTSVKCREFIREELTAICRRHWNQAAGSQPAEAAQHSVSASSREGVIWMEYRRDPKAMGGDPFIRDDEYAALFTRCLSRSASILCEEIRRGKSLARIRQVVFLRLLIDGLEACEFDVETVIAYLKYHRDWVLRFPFWRSRRPAQEFQEAAHRYLRAYDRHAAAHRQELEPLAEMARRRLARAPTLRQGARASTTLGWSKSFAILLRCVNRLHLRPEFYLDPYADVPLFSMVFKTFNMAANQLGLGMEEGFVTHFLFRSLAGSSRPDTIAYSR
jgi:hypothetical protein